MNKKTGIVLGGLSCLLTAAAALSLTMGNVPIGAAEAFGALFGAGSSSAAGTIVVDIRLPRTLMAVVTGAALSVSGAVFQGLLRNPLADPYLLGVSSGAALGAVAVYAVGLTGLAWWLLPLSSLAGAVLAVYLVYLLSLRDGDVSPNNLILAGVMVSSFASAAVLVLNVLMEARQLQGAFFWVMGSFASARWNLLPWVVLAVVVGLAAVMLNAVKLNLISQGDETAASLGLDVLGAKRLFFFMACLMTAAVVAVSGLIGFVGLVVPHAARGIIGADHRRLVPASALLGGSLLLLGDIAARTVLSPAELPVGVVTALVGAPVFLYLLKRQGMSAWL